MIASKSDKISVHFKTLGNQFYSKSKFSEALLAYNKALAYAVCKENLSLAYSNRSAVYLELKKYEMCLQNIQWALENEYPMSKIPKLLERKEKCEKLQAAEVITPEEDLKEFFKLSYPCNPKIPFIIDGLEVRKTKKFGRGIFTTRDLKLGDIISIEKPILMSMADGGQYSHCCLCLTTNQKNLIPCLKTASLMFCSIECRDEIYKETNPDLSFLISSDLAALFPRILFNYEKGFGGREKLLQFITETDFKKWKKTVFDYDFSDRSDPNYRMNALKSILSYAAPMDYKMNKKTNAELVGKVAKGNRFYQNFLEHMSVVWGTSVMSIMTNPGIDFETRNSIYEHNRAREIISQEFRFHLFSPLMNYSCFPNVQRVITNERIILYVTRPIKANEELFRCPSAVEIFNHPPEQRRVQYRFNNCFICQCYYCENNYTAKSLPLGNFELPIDGYENLKTNKKKIEKIVENFKVIEKYEACAPGIGTLESFYMCITNHTLMNNLGNLMDI